MIRSSVNRFFFTYNFFNKKLTQMEVVFEKLTLELIQLCKHGYKNLSINMSIVVLCKTKKY